MSIVLTIVAAFLGFCVITVALAATAKYLKKVTKDLEDK